MNTKGNTCRRTAITVPGTILANVDRAAKARGESRSRFISRVLEAAIAARNDADITRRLNRLFRDPEVAREQKTTAAALDRAGTRWPGERW